MSGVFDKPHQHILNPLTARCCICFAISWPAWGEPKTASDALIADLLMVQRDYVDRVNAMPSHYAPPSEEMVQRALDGETRQ